VKKLYPQTKLARKEWHDDFVQVHVINLKRRPDRINRVTERFENIGVSIAPHLAFDVNSCPPESNLQLVPNGLLANWRSHESLLAQKADSEDLYSLILEDDAVPGTEKLIGHETKSSASLGSFRRSCICGESSFCSPN